MNKAVFLDRDGTIIEEANYLSSPSQVRWIPGVPQALAKLAQDGWLLIIVTNQSGVARGYFSLNEVQKVYQYLQRELASYGAQFTAQYCCPHHPQYSRTEAERYCLCRKPQPGLFLQAQKDWNIDFKSSMAFGDKLTDLMAPLSLGCRSFLVQTGYGPQEWKKIPQKNGPVPNWTSQFGFRAVPLFPGDLPPVPQVIPTIP